MHPRPRRLSPVLLFSLLPIAGWFIVRSLMEPHPRFPGLYASFGLSILALVSTLYLIPALGPIFVQANLKGKDQLKSYDDPMFVNRALGLTQVLTSVPDRRAWGSSAHQYIYCY